MRQKLALLSIAAVLTAFSGQSMIASADNDKGSQKKPRNIQVGPRPYYLVADMDPGPLKTALQQCSETPLKKTDFSIGHRGAALQFPEHTKESYEAAVRMGAGIVECDVTFTKDKELVCRHSQCDLHTTTNILATPWRLTVPSHSHRLTLSLGRRHKLSAVRAISHWLSSRRSAARWTLLTLTERLSWNTWMEPRSWRTDLYSYNDTLLSHAESIRLFTELGVKMTPELKAPSVPMPFQGTYTQEQYAQQMIDEYKAAGVAPKKVWAQSFNLNDVRYWINHEPAFGKQAVYLDDANFPSELPSAVELQSYAAQGVKIVAPPMWALVALQGNRIVRSQYAVNARAAGLHNITWTLERSGLLTDGGGFYYQTVSPVINKPGDMLEVLDVLARDVGVLGIFSDWPGTVTYYANCMGLK